MAISKLSLDHLRVLVTITDTGSFSAAARHLRRAQSAISQSVAMLEHLQGVTLFDRSGHRPRLTDVGFVLVEQARLVLASVSRFEAVAANHRSGLEAELTLAIDPLVPTMPLMESLRALNERYPDLPIRFATEGLGGALRRLRDSSASLALCPLLPLVPEDVVAYPLLRIELVPVVSPAHPLATLQRAITASELEPHTQLVLSDPIDTKGFSYGVSSSRQWRFVDLNKRMDFLMSGFGWCRMPRHAVSEAVADGRLIMLDIDNDSHRDEPLTIFAAHLRGKIPGMAGKWLLEEMHKRLYQRF